MVENVFQIRIDAIFKHFWKNQHHICEKDYIWNPATCSCKIGKYLLSIIEDSVIICDEIIEESKTIPTNFNEKNIICETICFNTTALLIAVSIYFCLTKCKPKQKHWLPCLS